MWGWGLWGLWAAFALPQTHKPHKPHALIELGKSRRQGDESEPDGSDESQADGSHSSADEIDADTTPKGADAVGQADVQGSDGTESDDAGPTPVLEAGSINNDTDTATNDELGGSPQTVKTPTATNQQSQAPSGGTTGVGAKTVPTGAFGQAVDWRHSHEFDRTRYAYAYEKFQLPDACKEEDGKLRRCNEQNDRTDGTKWPQGPLPCDVSKNKNLVPGLKLPEVDICMVNHDLISVSLIDLMSTLEDSADKWKEHINLYQNEVQLKMMEMKLRQQNSQTIADLFAQAVFELEDAENPQRRYALESIALSIQKSSSKRFSDVINIHPWMANALQDHPMHIRANEAEALRLFDKYKTERNTLEQQRQKTLQYVRELLQAVESTSKVLDSIWAPFSKIEAAIGSVLVDLEANNRESPEEIDPPVKRSTYHRTSRGEFSHGQDKRNIESEHATGQMACRWPEFCQHCPLSDADRNDLMDMGARSTRDQEEANRKLLANRALTDDPNMICRNKYGECSGFRGRDVGGSGIDEMPCGSAGLVSDMNDLFQREEEEGWRPCWVPMIFQGSMKLSITSKELHMTFAGFNFLDGVHEEGGSCMIAVLVPAIQGSCTECAVSDPLEYHTGECCRTRATEESGYSDPCALENLSLQELSMQGGLEKDCSSFGDSDGVEQNQCFYMHAEPSPLVRPFQMTAEMAREGHVPPPGLQQVEYTMLAKNTRIAGGEEWFVVCVIQEVPKEHPKVTMPSSQLAGAFCVANEDMTEQGRVPTFGRCASKNGWSGGSNPTFTHHQI